MKLTHLILLALVSVGIAASPNESDDTEDVMIDVEEAPAIYFPGVVDAILARPQFSKLENISRLHRQQAVSIVRRVRRSSPSKTRPWHSFLRITPMGIGDIVNPYLSFVPFAARAFSRCTVISVRNTSS
jgi:hypothetical protein